MDFKVIYLEDGQRRILNTKVGGGEVDKDVHIYKNDDDSETNAKIMITQTYQMITNNLTTIITIF
eukprot:UN01270